MLVPVLIALLLVLAGFLAYVAGRPDSFRVERSAVIRAAPENIFAMVNDLGQWRAWSPYEKKDPAMQRSFSGSAAGLGAVYGWEGNKNVGAGRMEIIESSAPSTIRIQLDFFKPFEGHNVAIFTFLPGPDGTQVSWAMEGRSPFVGKLMGVVFSMDKMIGTDFAVGLDNLKAVAEK